MRQVWSVPVAVLLFVGAALAGPTPNRPPDVPPRSVHPLDHASYVELAKQWRAYIEEHGESPEALVNLGMAYDYTDEKEAALKTARRAVALAPDAARPLMFLGKELMVWAEKPDSAITLLDRSRRINPDDGYTLTLLATAYLRAGQLDQADAVFKTVHERAAISRPLQDYGYNMLIGLPKDAILITNGDNDTYPPLALQAGMQVRQDVIVLNNSLLNLPAYAEAEFNRHPRVRPSVDIEHHELKMVGGKPTWLSTAIIRALIAERKAPVYIAVSLPIDDYGLEQPEAIEGINWRASGKGREPEDAARLFLDTYRLDSATDWTVPWSLAPGEVKLIGNYVEAMIRAARQDRIDAETRSLLLDRAAAIAKFHDLNQWLGQIDDLRKQ